MPENKRQHYVPQLYLRYFSDNRKTIPVYSIKDRKIVTENAPIDRQCYQNYMYSDDLEVEKAITRIENVAKSIIDSIIKNHKLPKIPTDDYFALTVFILYQSARTLFSAELLNETTDKLIKMILEDHIKLSRPDGITVEDLEKVKVSYKQPALFILGMISQMIPLIFDLKYKLIINQTNLNFITSDNPVIFYNKYYLNDFFNYTGIASKGLL
ncbi:DUF4238 domain-containing protein, partial [bacterium]|nr:DUF4238 domain-containing protein [bacterium]